MSRPRPSRSHSRVPLSRAHSRASSIVLLPGGADVLIVPDGPIGSSASGLLGDLVVNHHETEATSSTLIDQTENGQGCKISADSSQQNTTPEATYEDDEAEIQELEERQKRPFYRRPSAWWVLGTILLASMAFSSTIAPRVEVYTTLACQALKPEYAVESQDRVKIEKSKGTLPPPSKMCGQDPDVQAAVAKLITAMTVSMGILSCLTTGWWGQLSDRYGRVRILGIAVIGLLATDFNFILVSVAADRLPGGYRFLLVGPVLDGLLGGMATLIAALHAYVSDCTPADGRSRIFSLNMGLLFAGMAIGPTLGSLLIRVTHNLLSVFYLATASHILYGVLIWSILPESLTKASMRRARKRRGIARDDNVAREGRFTLRARIWSLIKIIFIFLAPLNIFVPYKRTEGGGWSYSLTLLVIGYGFAGLLMGSYQFKFQYAQKTFGWNSEDMGYWLSFVGVVRAMHLVIILPLAIKYLKPKVAPIQLPVSPDEPLHSSQSSSTSGDTAQHPKISPKTKHSPLFDLNVARISLVIELASYAGMTLAMSSTKWIVASLFGALGGGFSPALQSVALALYERGPNQGLETGRLFGGLSVMQALSTQIVGPSLFGFTYVSTVNTFPKGIFVVAGGAVTCSLLFVSLIRLPKALPDITLTREETAVESENRSTV